MHIRSMSTGATLAAKAAKRGIRTICVWSDVCPEELRGHSKHAVEHLGVVYHSAGKIKDTCDAVRKLSPMVRDVLCGSEPGVELADELSLALGLRTNGTAQSETRRNKFLQSSAAKKAGLATAAQSLVSSDEEVEAFLTREASVLTITGEFKAVVKPVDGAGSEGVTVCSSPDEVRATFNALQGTTNVLGRTNREVLLMEYLAGDEYVIDTVSRDGVHKCVAIWKYIKFPLNGAQNVFYGQRLLSIADEPHLAATVAYVFGVITALGIRNGAVHNECKYNGATTRGRERGAVMIESNCRLHGAEGSWMPIVERCLGYSHVSALLDAHEPRPEAFDALPPTPSKMLAHGAQVGVRSVVDGIISHINHEKVELIRAVPSYDSESLPWNSTLAVGQKIVPTIDILTLIGQVQLVHADKHILEVDLASVQERIDAGLFLVAPREWTPLVGKRRERTISSDLQLTPAYDPKADVAARRETIRLQVGVAVAVALVAVVTFATVASVFSAEEEAAAPPPPPNLLQLVGRLLTGRQA